MHARLRQPFGLSQLRGCGTVVSSPLVGLSASLGRAPPPPPVCFASELLKVLHFFRSFKTIQCFNQVSVSFVCSFSLLWLSPLSFLCISTAFIISDFFCLDVRPRIWLVIHKPFLPRKEVIQPHLPIRLPCYDFTPVIGLTFDGCALSVHSPASGAPNSHGVTGGVYKARERIHRGMLIRDY